MEIFRQREKYRNLFLVVCGLFKRTLRLKHQLFCPKAEMFWNKTEEFSFSWLDLLHVDVCVHARENPEKEKEGRSKWRGRYHQGLHTAQVRWMGCLFLTLFVSFILFSPPDYQLLDDHLFDIDTHIEFNRISILILILEQINWTKAGAAEKDGRVYFILRRSPGLHAPGRQY